MYFLPGFAGGQCCFDILDQAVWVGVGKYLYTYWLRAPWLIFFEGLREEAKGKGDQKVRAHAHKRRRISVGSAEGQEFGMEEWKEPVGVSQMSGEFCWGYNRVLDGCEYDANY